jgi:hypothetical protein
MAPGRCMDYAEALRELWPPSVAVPSVPEDEKICLPFTGGYAKWGCVTPHFYFHSPCIVNPAQ